jgi:ubiquinone biosynthesis protein COQ4
MKRPNNPIRFREAWQAIRVLMKNPDDTAQVFKIISALAGNAGERQFERFLSSEHGPAILAEKRSLLDRLSDRAYLASLPDDSLGGVYRDFTDREQISPTGLIEASEAAPNDGQPIDPERMLFGNRMRDSHDLWHVVTGYGRDLIGEASLLAFTYGQTRNRGIGFIVLVAYIRAGRVSPEPRAMIRGGLRRSKNASWLPSADWEALLERPLDEVRKTLGVVPVESYSELRSEGAPAIA